MLTSTITELEMEIACRDEQVRVIKAVLELQSPDDPQAQLAAAQQERAELCAALAKQQVQAEDAERAAAAQLALAGAALAQANVRLRALGAAPVAAPAPGAYAAAAVARASASFGGGGGGDCSGEGGPAAPLTAFGSAMDQQMLSPPRRGTRSSPGGSAEGPSTPLSPSQGLRHARAGGSLSGSAGGSGDGGVGPGAAPHATWATSPIAARLAPVRCSSPVACGGGLGGGGGAIEEEPVSPRSDLSGPTWGADASPAPSAGGACGATECGRCGSPASIVAGARARGSAVFAGRLARDNPLFRSSIDASRRGTRGGGAAAGARGGPGGGRSGGGGGSVGLSLDCGSLLRASMASLDDMRSSLAGGGGAAFGLAQAQLEIQVGGLGRACLRAWRMR
ncbi:MAG: hypothetical protein J3K34DRAFT_175265 [Monoraphidium minutum]|nr:MAG: hypothetical protein J3K34DRAFT_175265 [Monoraphidium minutum]